jgi:hypothetical protein
MGFTKLFSDIVMSTIWREDDKTRIVWITMLATADADGNVNASVPGLADASRVSVEDCRKALEILLAPDPDSRSEEYEGRRIKKIDGGWNLLNYAKYREKTASRAEYFRKYRQNLKTVAQQNATEYNSPLRENTQAEAEAEAEVKNKNYCPTSEEVRLAALLGELILARKPDFQNVLKAKKNGWQQWAKNISAMLRLDNRPADRIEAVVKWSQGDSFWQNNILSTEKLRKQFDKLELRMSENHGNGRKTTRVDNIR